MKLYDVIIIGGGASGMLSSILIKQKDNKKSVLVLDKNFALGRKLLITGNGRCNLTNSNLNLENIHKYYTSDNLQILDNTFTKYDYEYINKFFNKLGIMTYIEDKNNNGKVFPITNSARNILKILELEIKNLGVELSLQTECLKIKKNSKIFELQIQKDNKISLIYAKNVILATGGKSYPSLGSDGNGYTLAKNLGHRISTLTPAAVSLKSNNVICKKLAGNKINAKMSLYINNKLQKSVTDDLLFTKYGLSGSGILMLSKEANIALNNNEKVHILIDLLPEMTKERLKDILSHEDIEKRLLGLLQYNIVQYYIANFKDDLINKIKELRIDITGNRGWNHAEFTAGGVSCLDINIKTLESQIVQNLYFAGEILNVDGIIGGFNLSWAWSSAFVVSRGI